MLLKYFIISASVLQGNFIFFIMKRVILLILCMIFLLAPSADAALGSKGLIVNRGEEVVVQKGEKKWLFVQDGFTKLPALKGLTFYSDNTVVFSVGLHSGVVRGNSIGTAKLTVVNRNGDCGYVTVRVVRTKKVQFFWLFAMFAAIVFFLIFIKKRPY